MFSKEKLMDCFLVAEKSDAVNDFLVSILEELPQTPVPVDINDDGELLVENISKYLNTNEIFIENPDYLTEKKDFMIFDEDGELLCQVLPDNEIKVVNRLNANSDNENDIFVEFCYRLQNKSGVKFPKLAEV